MSRSPSPFRNAVLLFAGAVALTAAGLYGTGRLRGNSAGSCSASAAITKRVAPLAKGEVAAFQVSGTPTPAPPLAFDGPEGQRLDLADFRGRTVLFNLWATWCEPCKREMPALDRLQGQLGGDRFTVAAVNIDTRNLDRPRAWLRDAGIARLAWYGDAKAAIFQDLKRAGLAEGLPTTLLVGPDGCLVGHVAGWAEWDSADSLALIRTALAEGSDGRPAR
jgi:thiol-disulfide isomerase/thioredoxin